MTVVANDFVPVVPYDTDVFTLGVSGWVSVRTSWSRRPASQWTLPGCVRLPKVSWREAVRQATAGQHEAMAAIYYENVDPNAIPNTKSEVAPARILDCSNEALTRTVPYYKIKPALNPQHKQMDITFRSNGTHMGVVLE